MAEHLPTFEKPPLDEVVMGLQFAPLKAIRSPHIGLYWSRIREQYPRVEDQQPLPHLVEPDGLRPERATIAVQHELPMRRCWLIDQTGNELIQVQQDRFLRNWRQQEGAEVYPRFGPLFQRFLREWEGFEAFLQEENLGKAEVDQAELSYVNNIGAAIEMGDFSAAEQVFSVGQAKVSKGFLPKPELFAWDSRYTLPQGRGRLHVQMSPAFRSRDFQLMLGLTLTARGKPESGLSKHLTEWFDLAHEWIVRAFAELTGERMHAIWRKQT